MRQSFANSRPPEWQVLSTYVRYRDGRQRLEQAFRLLLGCPRPAEAATLTNGRSDHACRDLRPCLDRSPRARPDD